MSTEALPLNHNRLTVPQAAEGPIVNFRHSEVWRGLNATLECYAETTRTELRPPNGFWTLSLAFGSGNHWPSTTNRYSCRPVIPVRSPIHLPSLARVSGAGCHPLNEPATETDLASGLTSSRWALETSALTG